MGINNTVGAKIWTPEQNLSVQ